MALETFHWCPECTVADQFNPGGFRAGYQLRPGGLRAGYQPRPGGLRAGYQPSSGGLRAGYQCFLVPCLKHENGIRDTPLVPRGHGGGSV